MDNLIVITIVAVIVVFALRTVIVRSKSRSSCCGSGSYQAKSRKLGCVVKKITFQVEGMHCQHCVNRVMESVQDIPYTSASVNLKKGTVTVSMERNVDAEQIRAAIEKGGYTVTGVN